MMICEVVDDDDAAREALPAELPPSSSHENRGGGGHWTIDVHLDPAHHPTANFAAAAELVENKLPNRGQQSRWLPEEVITLSKLPYFILNACRKVSMLLLLILSLLTLGSGMAEQGLQTGWIIGSCMLVFWLLRVSCASLCSFYRARKMEKMLSRENNSEVTVMRRGHGVDPREEVVIRHCDIQKGDIVILTANDRIPADGVLVDDDGLVLDGVAEAAVAHNNCGGSRRRHLYSGAKVRSGSGLMEVTAAGADTELSKTMSSVNNFKDGDDELLLEARLKKPNPFPANHIRRLKKETLLRRWIDEPLAQLGNLALIVLISCVVVDFLLFSFFDQNRKNGLVQQLKGATGVEGLIKIFKLLLNNGGKVVLLSAFISTLVFFLQHGIKIVISISLENWNGMRGPSEQFRQNSSAATTLGVTSVICLDISGRLMFPKRVVNRFQIGQEPMHNVGNCTSAMSQNLLEPLVQGVGASLLVPGKACLSKTEDLIISWVGEKWDVDIKSYVKERFEIVFHRKLGSNKEGRGVLLQTEDNGETIWVSHWKGDANTILGMCSYYHDPEGRIHEIKSQKGEFEQVIKEMENNGMRTIAFAYKQTQVQELLEDGLCLLAIVGIKYQCDEEMKSTIRALTSFGRSIKLVSKHKPSTMRAMAWALGVSSPVSTEEALETEHPISMVEKMGKITLMRSSSPEDKVLMLKSLKQKDNIVAFIGGWATRDAPVLLEADVGITVGTWSTELTREISDIVLTSVSNFSSLITIMESGGREYKKIQKFIQIQMINNISALLISTTEIVCLGESSITIWQVFYLNVVLAVLGGLMLAIEPQQKEQGNNRVGKRKESIITEWMKINMLVQVSYQITILLVLSFRGEAFSILPGVTPMNQDSRKAMIFNGFLLCQLFNYLHPFFDSGKKLCWMYLVAFTAIGMHVLLFTELWLKLNTMQWALCFLIVLPSWVINLATTLIPILQKTKGRRD